MKSFFSLFSESAENLKNIRTIAVTGVLMALAIVLRFIAVPITPDIRISFAFLGTILIAMLYGPVVAALGALGVDLIGYILDGAKMRDYNLLLALTVILSGIICGVLTYHRKSEKSIIVWACIARLIDMFVNNLCFKSMILYGSYVNSDFPFKGGWDGFFTWCLPRLISESIQAPIDIVLIVLAVPAIIKAYKAVFHKNLA